MYTYTRTDACVSVPATTLLLGVASPAPGVASPSRERHCVTPLSARHRGRSTSLSSHGPPARTTRVRVFSPLRSLRPVIPRVYSPPRSAAVSPAYPPCPIRLPCWRLRRCSHRWLRLQSPSLPASRPLSSSLLPVSYSVRLHTSLSLTRLPLLGSPPLSSRRSSVLPGRLSLAPPTRQPAHCLNCLPPLPLTPECTRYCRSWYCVVVHGTRCVPRRGVRRGVCVVAVARLPTVSREVGSGQLEEAQRRERLSRKPQSRRPAYACTISCGTCGTYVVRHYSV